MQDKNLSAIRSKRNQISSLLDDSDHEEKLDIRKSKEMIVFSAPFFS